MDSDDTVKILLVDVSGTQFRQLTFILCHVYDIFLYRKLPDIETVTDQTGRQKFYSSLANIEQLNYLLKSGTKGFQVSVYQFQFD